MSNSPHQRDGSASQPRTSTESAGVYVPPHLSANRNGATTNENRYAKDSLLSLFKGHDDSENIAQALTDLYVGGWDQNTTNGASSAAWGRHDSHKDNHGADLCWDREHHMLPMGLHDMGDEERDVGAS